MEREIDVLYAEMHDKMSRADRSVIGIAYARYSTDFQHSVVDQLRAIFEHAIKLGIYIPREYVFFDLGVRGCKEKRPGLDPVRDVVARKAAQVLLVFTTNRLFRKNYKCMKFVEEEIVERGLRCIFIKSGIDTAEDNRWRLPLQIHTLHDEFGSTAYAENIRAAHEGLFLKKFVVYTLPFGFTGKEVPGRLTKRMRPRREIVIDPETAEWVRKIFTWFVDDRIILSRIVERLNDQSELASPMSYGDYWTFDAVRYLLSNEAYRGQWYYGKGQNVWQSSADYTKRVIRDKPLREAHFEELRIVSDQTWYAAQKLLLELPQKNAGRKPRDGNTTTRPRLLNGLLFCKVHDRPLRVGGKYGQHMYCPECRTLPKEKRAIFSYQNRAQALRLTCQAVAERIRSDASLVEAIVVACRESVAKLQTKGGDKELRECKSRVEKIDRQIRFIIANPGVTDADHLESAKSLGLARAERAKLQSEVADLEAAKSRTKQLPTEDDVRRMIADLEGIFLHVAAGNEPENTGALRALLELLTGGRIEIVQKGERKRQRGWLQAEFQLRLDAAVGKHFGVASEAERTSVVVDFRETTIAESKIRPIMELFQQGKLYTAIANELGIDRHQVAAAVRIWHERQGLPAPLDGRVRRATVPEKRLNKSAEFKAIAEKAKALYDEDLLIEQIAEKLGYCRDTIHDSLVYWFESRGQKMPDGRNRRKLLAIKNRPKSL